LYGTSWILVCRQRLWGNVFKLSAARGFAKILWCGFVPDWKRR
jgi:hypothetical protein